MLLKNTVIGDIELNGRPEDEADIRNFIETLHRSKVIELDDGIENPRATHRVVNENGVRKFFRFRYS